MNNFIQKEQRNGYRTDYLTNKKCNSYYSTKKFNFIIWEIGVMTLRQVFDGLKKPEIEKSLVRRELRREKGTKFRNVIEIAIA